MKPCNESEIVGLDATYRKYYLKGYEAAEKEHNYHLKKIRAEIEKEIIPRNSDQYDHEVMWQNMGLRMALKIIDKYMVEGSDKK